MASATTSTARLSASLSAVPNRSTTSCLAPGGCRSMTSDPTAVTSDGAPATAPASSSLSAKAQRAGDEPRDGRAEALLHRRSEAHRRDGRVTPA